MLLHTSTRTYFRLLWPLCILLFASLACSQLTDTQQKVGSAQATARHVATQVKEGRNLVATVQGLATQVGGSELVSTLKAVATDVDESGYLETAQAVATEHGPSLIATAKAYATQEGPALAETVKAYATQFAASGDEAPADIPVLAGEKLESYTNSKLVSYVTSTKFSDALAFYLEQMPRQGWIRTDDGSGVSASVAILTYTKADRTATVRMSVNPLSVQTIVLITIE